MARLGQCDNAQPLGYNDGISCCINVPLRHTEL